MFSGQDGEDVRNLTLENRQDFKALLSSMNFEIEF